VYAGAVRETVFSNPEVIRRVNADFVPVFVSPPHSSIMQSGDVEARLFQSVYQSRVADQGICVTNASGQALDWVVMFDSNESILSFLDHSRKRFQQLTDAKQPVLTERYTRFPSQKLEDAKSEALTAPISERHPVGSRCPAIAPQSQLGPGTVSAEVVGRALDANGALSADTLHQERYAGDQFYLGPDIQEALAKSFAAAGTKRVRLPDELGHLCVMHAYLGQTDVRPLSNPLGGTSELKQCEFWAQSAGDRNRPGLMRVHGRSAVLVESADAGHSFLHEITLAWEGFIEMKGSRVASLVLAGRGTEKLKWGGAQLHSMAASGKAVAYLVAGHPIDWEGEVRYGIIGRPLASR
jgi:hypothetical protein